MIAEIEKCTLKGEITAPTSKSMTHRLLICAALAQGESSVSGVTFSQDILATLDCLAMMGVKYRIDADTVTLLGLESVIQTQEKLFDCRESGSTLRFFLPILLLSEKKQTFTGHGRLMQRPMSVYEDICKQKGLYYKEENSRLTVCGKLTGGDITVKGDISSQFITGLLFALSLCEEDSRIHILPPVESRSYINMTIGAMAAFGVSVTWENGCTLYIKGKQKYHAGAVSSEGDYSSCAFLDAFNLLGGKVTVLGMNENSLQGDKIYKQYYQYLACGAPTLDVSDCPDLAPILMALAAALGGATLTGTRRLKIKESDRGVVMAQELAKFGAQIAVKENEIVIKKAALHSADEILHGHNDHRIVMSLAVLCTLFGGKIDDAHAAAKSFPTFFEDMKKLGGKVTLYGN